MNKINQMVLCAFHLSLIIITTCYFKIPNGYQGYIHLGDTFIFLYASFTNPFYAILASGIGSMLADFISGYSIYMIPSFFIKGLQALLISLFLKKYPNKKQIIYILAAMIMIIGYFFFEAFMYDFNVALFSIFANIIQAFCSIFITLFAYPTYFKLFKSYNFFK